LKVINAFWDTQNLGVSTTEIQIDSNETIEEIERDLTNLLESRPDNHYTVIKIDPNCHDIACFISEKGFRFAEVSLGLRLKIEGNEVKTPKIFEKLDKNITYKQALEDTQLLRLEREILNEMFSTDRISIDPRFGKHIAAKRYLNWLKEEMAAGAFVFELFYNNTPIGFFAIKELEVGKYFNFLGGLYASFQNSGYGFSIISKAMEVICAKHGKYFDTRVSLNNLPVFRLYQEYRFQINSVKYVYINY